MSVTIHASEKTAGEKAQVVDTTGKRKRSKKAKQPEQQTTKTDSEVAAEFVAKQHQERTVGQAAEQAPKETKPKESATVELVLSNPHLFLVGTLPGETSERWIDARQCEDFDAKTGRVVVSRAVALKKKWIAA